MLYHRFFATPRPDSKKRRPDIEKEWERTVFYRMADIWRSRLCASDGNDCKIRLTRLRELSIYTRLRRG